MKEILHTEEVSPPRRGLDGLQRHWPDKPVRLRIDHHQHQHVDRPDAQRPAPMKVVKVMRLVARSQQDRGDQEAGEHKEENDPRPSPLHRAVQAGPLQLLVVAVIQHYRQNREAPQAVEFRQISGQPGWALESQWWVWWSQVAVLNPCYWRTAPESSQPTRILVPKRQAKDSPEPIVQACH